MGEWSLLCIETLQRIPGQRCQSLAGDGELLFELIKRFDRASVNGAHHVVVELANFHEPRVNHALDWWISIGQR